MSVITSSALSSVGGAGFVPAARNGIDSVSKSVQEAEVERSTGIEDQNGKHVDALEQKSQIDQLEKEIDNKEKEKSQNIEKSDEELSQLEKQLAELIDRFSKNPTNVTFGHSKTSSGQVIDVIDSETRETIRQIPSEEAIAIKERLQELSDMYNKGKSANSNFDKEIKSILLDAKV